MDKKFLEKYLKENIQIKINLKNGYFYNGYILKIEGNTVLFKDKYGTEIPIDLDSISYIVEVQGGQKWIISIL